jgi:DNA-binding NarL/FixJ family response regulator
MDSVRRERILASYRARARRFDEIARRRSDTAQPITVARVDAPPTHLSPRARQVLRLLAEGFENKEIAIALRVTPETIKSHVKNLLTCLGAKNRAHAVAIAFRRDLLRREDEPVDLRDVG